MENSLIAAYLQTDYSVSGFRQPIQVGEISVEADAFLKEHQVSEWAYLTAYNPLSYPLGPKENESRNQQLIAQLKNFVVLEGEGCDRERRWPPEKSFFVAGISLADARHLASAFGQRAIVYGKVNQAAELVETLDFVGHSKIITYPKTAFLCSDTVPASAVLTCYDWAIEQREKGHCVISGFHSQLEKDVLHYLLEGQQPVMVVLARGFRQKREPAFEKALEQGRLLIITPFGKSVKRVSSQTAQIRNHLMTALADQITIGYASPGGQLEELLKGIEKPITRIL